MASKRVYMILHGLKVDLLLLARSSDFPTVRKLDEMVWKKLNKYEKSNLSSPIWQSIVDKGYDFKPLNQQEKEFMKTTVVVKYYKMLKAGQALIDKEAKNIARRLKKGTFTFDNRGEMVFKPDESTPEERKLLDYAEFSIWKDYESYHGGKPVRGSAPVITVDSVFMDMMWNSGDYEGFKTPQEIIEKYRQRLIKAGYDWEPYSSSVWDLYRK